ncbi:hypothetical protein BW685_14230 [Burkholderia ubonensis]|uniref:Fimbrial-type adhesion domain-containing protein n=1 Tax=Burkholderia ubonensis TaxID=101571 RepID=A0A1R1JCC8_9BURK|nr:hypothetical protein BW685_14230 [Burkholderia ubonensis]
MTVTSQTCKVKNSSIDVALPTVMVKEMKDVGSTAGDTKFSIDLHSCTIGTSVSLTLTDITNPGNTSNVLSLNKSSSAKGIGYQILYDSSPVSFGPDSAAAGTKNQWSLGKTTSEDVSIPLTARYLRTSNTVVPGAATGQASFTMSYQ